MLQIIYISTAQAGITSSDCRDILKNAQLNNLKLGVTGLLLFNSKRFLQVLEGPDKYVDQLVKMISSDSRHRAVVQLSRKPIDHREFGDWSMAFDDGLSNTSLDLKARVAMLLERTSASTRALFETTAELHRAIAG